MSTTRTDILIVGGGAGGVSAALAAARLGASCVLTEATEVIGGQFTTQAVPPDENRWVEGEGSSRSYAALRAGVRRWYQQHGSLTPEAAANPTLNPGNGWVSRLCAKPRVFHAVLRAMLAEHEAGGRCVVRTGLTPIGVDVQGDRVRAVRFTDAAGGEQIIEAALILDATETGDLYPLGGIEHMTGSECREQFGELHALPRAEIAALPHRPDGAADEPGRINAGGDPYDQQAVSWCFAIEHHPGQDRRISKPARYDFWRAHVPAMRDVPWTGPLLDWTVPSHNEAGRRTFPFIPCPDDCDPAVWEMWRYRRIVDRAVHAEGPDRPTDVCLVNWVQMDYWLRPLLGVTPAARELAEREAKELSRCLLYWMQTDAVRWSPDGKPLDARGYPGLALAGETLMSADGFALRPYIREPRRLLARTVLTEGHIGVEQRELEAARPGIAPGTRPRLFVMRGSEKQHLAEPFEDSIGIGHYTLDLHPSTAGRNSVYVPAAPFRVPLGSLVPVRVRNLIAAGKGIGVTHIANGCTRMHQVEWTIGEAAGTLAAFCLARALAPAQIHASLERTHELQATLHQEGVPIRWSWE